MTKSKVKTKGKLSSSYEEKVKEPMIVMAEFRIRVMLQADSLAEASAMLSATDLGYIIGEMNDGEWLGTHEFTGVQQVFPWEVASASQAMGGPSDFFADKD
jgi:hypothetical protein